MVLAPSLSSSPSPGSSPAMMRLRRALGIDDLTRSRGERTLIVLIGVALLSLGDLYMTLTFATSVGMIEGNPIARAVMALNCPILLIWWKAVMLVVTIALLVACRKRRVGELGAWLCLFILLWLTVRWGHYSDAMPELTQHLPKIAMMEAERWVLIER